MRYDLWVRPLWVDIRAALCAAVVMALLRYSSPATYYTMNVCALFTC